jgi:hypothetical protein
MKAKILTVAAGLAALCLASEANAQVLPKGYYDFTGFVTAATAGCGALVGTGIRANINWPGYGQKGFAMANPTNTGNPNYIPGVAVQNGFPNTPANPGGPAKLAAGWAGVASDAVYAYVAPNIVVVQAPTPATFTIALASPVNGTAFGTITFNVPALNCTQTLTGTMIESSS